MTDYVALAAAAFLAGMIDAVVGGDGLIQIPALFSPCRIPHPPRFSVRVNSPVSGVLAQLLAKRVKLQWSTAVPAASAAFVLSFVGAYIVTHIPRDFIRKL